MSLPDFVSYGHRSYIEVIRKPLANLVLEKITPDYTYFDLYDDLDPLRILYNCPVEGQLADDPDDSLKVKQERKNLAAKKGAKLVPMYLHWLWNVDQVQAQMLIDEAEKIKKSAIIKKQRMRKERQTEALREENNPQVPIVKNIFADDPLGNQSDIHSYAYSGKDKVEVLGRKKEQDALRRFINENHEKKFLWLQVAGVAGQGKSRLGWDLIQEARADTEFKWEAGFWQMPSGTLTQERKEAFIEFWEQWLPDKPYLLVLDYVVATGSMLAPIMRCVMERADTFQYPVRLLLLERQRWDRGGLTFEVQSQSKDDFNNRFVSSEGGAAWFDDLQQKAGRHNLSASEFLFEKHGIIELKKLSREDLFKIVKHVFKVETGGRDLLKSDKEIEKSLERIDREGRPLYAYFLGKALASEKDTSSWTRTDLLKSVLANDQRKRWRSVFSDELPALVDDIDAFNIALLATMAEGIQPSQLLDIENAPDVAGNIMRQALVLVNGPYENSVDAPADIIPPLTPDILGEWFALSTLKLRKKDKRKLLIQQAWVLSATGMARFIQRVAVDFPQMANDLGLFERPVRGEDQDREYVTTSSGLVYSLTKAKLTIPTTIIEALKQGVEMQDPSAMTSLAYFYVHEKSLPNHENMIFQLFKRSAELDFPPAMHNLGICYIRGLGVKQNDAEAVKWFSCASEAGIAEAAYILGACYQEGNGVEQNKVEAVRLYQQANEAGITRAMFNLGACYQQGIGVEQNKVEAVRWYRQAAQAGIAEAILNLGICYQEGNGVELDEAEAVRWYRKAVEAGDARAMSNLGICYGKGIGVEQDIAEAVRLFREAAEAGIAEAVYNLGVCYQGGNGVERNEAKAIRLYRQAVEAGDVNAMVNLGFCYQQGIGVEQDAPEAARWYRKAVEAGDARAMSNLGRCYHEGIGVEQNEVEAIRLFRQAAEAGIAGAMHNLGVCYQQGIGVEQDEVKSIGLYRQAVEAGDVNAMVNLGFCYQQGIGVGQDEREAAKWVFQAAKAGSAEAMFSLAICYQQGIGIAQDDTEAIKWYNRAAEAGFAGAMYNLGVCYQQGTGVKRDEAESAIWYSRAALAGDANAMNNLGFCYQHGIGVEQDQVEAVRWYLQAVEAGDTQAMHNLGECYWEGIGVSQDEVEAIRWYNQAAKAGIAEARLKLEEIGEVYQS